MEVCRDSGRSPTLTVELGLPVSLAMDLDTSRSVLPSAGNPRSFRPGASGVCRDSDSNANLDPVTADVDDLGPLMADDDELDVVGPRP